MDECIIYNKKRGKMIENLSTEKVKGFFQEFYEQYKTEAEKNPNKNKLTLFNSLPAKFELLFDRNMIYCALIVSKSQIPGFAVDNSYEDPLIVVAVANSKKSMYGRDFLYLFQVNHMRFPKLNVSDFVSDFINYELAKNVL